jgi:hypothetical protein
MCTVLLDHYIPYAEPTKYNISEENLNSSKPVISSLLLTGKAYDKN